FFLTFCRSSSVFVTRGVSTMMTCRDRRACAPVGFRAGAQAGKPDVRRAFTLIEFVGQAFQPDSCGARRRQAGKPDLRGAFNLIALLVVLALIDILIGLLL